MKECYCRGRNKECAHCNGFGFIRPDFSSNVPAELLSRPKSRPQKRKKSQWRQDKTAHQGKQKRRNNRSHESGQEFQAPIKRTKSNAPPITNIKTLKNAGLDALNAGNYELAKEIWTQQAENDNPAAQAALGLMYWKGVGVERDLEKSFRWYLQSAESGHAKAQATVASMFSKGTGVSKCMLNAYIWASLASRYGEKRGYLISREIRPRLSKEDADFGNQEIERIKALLDIKRELRLTT